MEDLAGVAGVSEQAFGAGQQSHVLLGHGIGHIVGDAIVGLFGSAGFNAHFLGCDMDAQLIFRGQLVDELGNLFGAAVSGAYRDTDHLKGSLEVLGASQQTAEGTHRAVAADQILGLNALFLHLLHDLGDGVDITGCTHQAASAHRYIIRMDALLFIFSHDLLGLLGQEGSGLFALFRLRQVGIGGGIDEVHIRAHHAVEDQVARAVIRLRTGQHQDRLHIVTDCRSYGHTAVVGLDTAEGHQGIIAVIQGVLHQIIQLSGLVAAESQAGHIVPLDIQFALAQFLGQIGHILQRCIQIAYMDAFKFGQFHSCHIPFVIRSVPGDRGLILKGVPIRLCFFQGAAFPFHIDCNIKKLYNPLLFQRISLVIFSEYR